MDSNERLTTIKVLKETRRLAKMLAAHYGISILDLLHRLVTAEAQRLGLTTELEAK